MKYFNGKQARKLVGLVAIDGFIFGLTNARNVPSWGLIVGFLLLVATFYYLISGLLSLTKLYGLVLKRRRRLTVILTGLVSGLVALQSIGELNLFDILVLLPIMAIGYIYSAYNRPAPADL